MASTWIKWTKGLTRKPKMMRLAHMWGISRHEAAGLCMEVWEWADESTVDGHVDVPVDMVVSTITSLTGRDDVVDGLSSVGWLTVGEDFVDFADFTVHNGDSAKKRACKTEAQKKWRDANVDTSVSTKVSTREEKRREEKIEEKTEEQTEERVCDPDTATRILERIKTTKYWPPSHGGFMATDHIKALIGQYGETEVEDLYAWYTLHHEDRFVPRVHGIHDLSDVVYCKIMAARDRMDAKSSNDPADAWFEGVPCPEDNCKDDLPA